jgi:hypothetical protein
VLRAVVLLGDWPRRIDAVWYRCIVPRWEIHVRVGTVDEWHCVWAGVGALAEDDARKTFGSVRAHFDGTPTGLMNRHASDWSSVRLCVDGSVIDEATRGRPSPRARSITQSIRPPRRT